MTTSLEEQFSRFLHKQPAVEANAFVAPGAVVIGDASLGQHSSVWYNATLRADINRIVIGPHSNIQDNAVVHVADEFPCIVGSYVTVGHGAILHACTVGDEVLVGMGAAILDGAVIGPQTLIGARALVTQGKEIPPGTLVLGSPARVVRVLTAEERAGLRRSAEKYVEMAAHYLARGLARPGSGPSLALQGHGH
jgi:gamma-carbonic anhydrase